MAHPRLLQFLLMLQTGAALCGPLFRGCFLARQLVLKLSQHVLPYFKEMLPLLHPGCRTAGRPAISPVLFLVQTFPPRFLPGPYLCIDLLPHPGITRFQASGQPAGLKAQFRGSPGPGFRIFCGLVHQFLCHITIRICTGECVCGIPAPGCRIPAPRRLSRACRGRMYRGTAYRAGAALHQFPCQDSGLVVQETLVQAFVYLVRPAPRFIRLPVEFLGLFQVFALPVVFGKFPHKGIHPCPVFCQLLNGGLGCLVILSCSLKGSQFIVLLKKLLPPPRFLLLVPQRIGLKPANPFKAFFPSRSQPVIPGIGLHGLFHLCDGDHKDIPFCLAFLFLIILPFGSSQPGGLPVQDQAGRFQVLKYL